MVNLDIKMPKLRENHLKLLCGHGILRVENNAPIAVRKSIEQIGLYLKRELNFFFYVQLRKPI